MNQFTSVHDVHDIKQLLNDALTLKENPYALQHLGKNKTLGLVFKPQSADTPEYPKGRA